MRRNLFWLNDDQWHQIEPHLPTDVRGKQRVDDRRVISGILHVLKSGCRWCDCPPEYGPTTTIYNRFVRWAERGVWERLFRELAAHGRSTHTQMIDSTHVKAHRSASGAKRMARPVGKWFFGDDIISLHKRIRPFGYAVGQDGDPRIPVLTKGTASSAILRHRVPKHRSTVRPSSSQPPADIIGRLSDGASQC